MVSIFKYQFDIVDEFVLEMPETSKVLTVQLQVGRSKGDGVPCLWAMVDTNMPMIDRHFTVKGTGHEINIEEKLDYIGTIQQMRGRLVWHVFERRTK